MSFQIVSKGWSLKNGVSIPTSLHLLRQKKNDLLLKEKKKEIEITIRLNLFIIL